MESFDCERKQKISLQTRPEHRGIQERGEHRRPSSARLGCPAAACRHSAACFAQLFSDSFGIVIAVDFGGCRQCVVLTFAALVAIGEHVVEQESMPVADSFAVWFFVGPSTRPVCERR